MSKTLHLFASLLYYKGCKFVVVCSFAIESLRQETAFGKGLYAGQRKYFACVADLFSLVTRGSA